MRLLNLRRFRPSHAIKRLRGPASDTIKRLSLADGAWWDIETRPTVRQFLRIQQIMTEGDEQTATFEVLAYLTDAWSWDGEITADTIQDRHMDALIEALEVFTKDIVPFLEGLPGRLKPSDSSST